MGVNSTHALVVIPHPDDAEYGVAGTVARWTAEGKEVVYAVCTSGDKGTNDAKMTPDELIKTREREQLAAATLLGVREVVFLRYPDQGLEDTPEFRKDIVRLIRKFRPEIVATTDPHRRYIWHRDHRIVGRVTLDAVFPFARDHLSYPELLEEGLEPHSVKVILCWGAEEPNYRSDITETFDLKMAALRAHDSQVGHYPSPEWEDQLRKRYKQLAEEEDFMLAEAFHRVEISW